jgi:F0F1-type ATP synthase assembly protein I
MEIVARAMVVALVGILAADFFITEQYGKQLWILLGLGPALLGIARRTYPQVAEEEERKPGRKLRALPRSV